MIKTTAAYELTYQGLNPEQKQAVDAIDGPVMVIAGPGTGKTQILATRIANILQKTDTPAGSVLALTFTESGAQAMRKRLVSLIGSTAYGVRIQTFHSFCSEVILENPESFPSQPDGEPLSDFERFQIFESILLKGNFEYLRPINNKILYVKPLVSAIQNLKREGVSVADFQHILTESQTELEAEQADLTPTQYRDREKTLKKNWETLTVFREYQEHLRLTGKFDFEDMITFTIQAFQNDELLLRSYQERLLYFLVDEYQDTNSAQNQVLDLLAEYWGATANIFVVGDPNQSIYRFQGASLENTYGFLNRYPAATVITLKKNYRNTQLLLDSAAEVIEKNPVPTTSFPLQLDVHLQSSIPDGQPITVYEASSNTLEYVYVAEKITELLKQGENPAEIAVLYRENHESAALADTLAKWGIRFQLQGGSDILKTPLVAQLLVLLRTLYTLRTGQESPDLFTLLNYPWTQLDPLITLKAFRYAHEHQLSPFKLLTTPALSREFCQELSEAEQAGCQKITDYAVQLMSWTATEGGQPFVNWLEGIIETSGFLSSILSRRDSVEQLFILNSLLKEVRQQAEHTTGLNLQLFLERVQLMQTHNLSITLEDINLSANAVVLSTVHKAKGLEWTHVFLTGFVDKKWGNTSKRELIKLPPNILQYQRTQADSNEDDRRLFYVALTRAKQHFTLTVPKTIIQGNVSREVTPSMLLYELPEQSVVKETEFEKNTNLPQLLKSLVLPTANSAVLPQESEYLQPLIDRLSISPTGLNTYLDCAYKFKLKFLIKAPSAKTPAQAFGTAIHRALEYLYQSLKTTTASIEDILGIFESSLRAEQLAAAEFAERLAKGKTLLTNYYNHYHDELTQPLAVEHVFGRGSRHSMLDDIALEGKVDKIEVLDPALKSVKIIDYKTGKPKSRNWIEGKTKDSDGSYKRQLVFYKMLADLDRSFPWKAQEGEFDFIEPMEKSGKYRKESFHITDEDVNELKAVIKNMMEKVRAFHFERTTNYSICHRCEFQLHCWPEGIPVQTAKESEG